jgi:MFS-type transporter involved in bile tolerance (Atg22 family)
MTTDESSIEPSPSSWLLVALAWLLVSIPLFWGIWQTVKKAAVLFR